jgi:hypothetical protein
MMKIFYMKIINNLIVSDCFVNSDPCNKNNFMIKRNCNKDIKTYQSYTCLGIVLLRSI